LQHAGLTEHRAFGDVDDSGRVLVIPATASGSPLRACSHALAAKSNAVVDVQVCGSEPPTRATTSIVEAIGNKLPRW
jgi:hypothetical protein